MTLLHFNPFGWLLTEVDCRGWVWEELKSTSTDYEEKARTETVKLVDGQVKVVIQVRDDCGIAQSSTCGRDGKRLDSESFLKEKPTVFTDRLYIDCERKRVPRTAPRSLV